MVQLARLRCTRGDEKCNYGRESDQYFLGLVLPEHTLVSIVEWTMPK